MPEENTFNSNLCEESNQHNDKKQNMDYDLDFDERIEKFKDCDLNLCEKCNQKLEGIFHYCKECYEKETDDIEKKRIRYGKCKECFQVKTSNELCLHCNSNHLQQDLNKC